MGLTTPRGTGTAKSADLADLPAARLSIEPMPGMGLRNERAGGGNAGRAGEPMKRANAHDAVFYWRVSPVAP